MERTDKRGKIFQAAMELIAERGFHGAPMAMIAERAGVAAGTIYRYFDNKDILITELYSELEEELRSALEEGYSVAKPIRERFLHLGIAILRYFIAHPLYFRYIEQYHNSPYGVSLRRDMIMSKIGKHNIFKDLFEQGIEQQVMKDLPITVIFALAFGPLLVLLKDHIHGFVILDDGLIRQVIDSCWDAIRR
ncbi:MAG: TetR/AcrR family transcriptional regulator [Deltaproteobacteria bacterium]|nr:TetR/AcrR family transcriptional regulator [Deltaproteobacteria bacterium]